MLLRFLKEAPIAFAKKESALIVGDLHIGKEAKLSGEGLHFAGATRRLSDTLLRVYKKTGAKRIVFLGDVKESITYPDVAEYSMLREFFAPFRDSEIYVAKGNHDSHIAEVLKQVGINATVGNEILLGDMAFMHGTSMPSKEAMSKRTLVTSHLHAQAIVNGERERVWIVANVNQASARRKYGKDGFNKGIELVIAPAFSNVVYGKPISTEYKETALLFRTGLFSFARSKIYGVDGRKLGTMQRVVG